MVFKRVLHPVGQGAFFTEQFYDESGKVVHNVVYDCGSLCSLPNLVEYEIRNTFEKNAHIDLLFISHFDKDHVNGLMKLHSQTKIDKDTKVIIPFRYPYLLMVMDEDYPMLARFVMQLFNIGAQVVGIDENADDNRLGEPIDIGGLDGNKPLGGKKVIRLDKVLWYYYPFMLPDQSSLQKVFEGKVKGIVNLDDPNEILTKRKELRNIYKTIGKTKGGVTKINVNTLFMLSFPAVNVAYNTNIWHQINLCGNIAPTCFYTGDSNLKGNGYDVVKQRVTDILDIYSKGTKVWMMQVPHHGSDKCFPEKMADRGDVFFECAFVNCNPWHRQKVFDSGIIGEFTRNNKTLLLVTECYHSRVELIAELFLKIKRGNDVDG
jgi:hypothetical protein